MEHLIEDPYGNYLIQNVLKLNKTPSSRNRRRPPKNDGATISQHYLKKFNLYKGYTV